MKMLKFNNNLKLYFKNNYAIHVPTHAWYYDNTSLKKT